MTDELLSVGIDIGTSTTQLVISRLTLENRANPFSVPRVDIARREVLYRSGIHFTPLQSDTVIDAEGVRNIVAEEYRSSGFDKAAIDTGAVIITGETARKEGLEARRAFDGNAFAMKCSQHSAELWKNIEMAAMRFTKEHTIEAADFFFQTVYGLGEKWRLVPGKEDRR